MQSLLLSYSIQIWYCILLLHALYVQIGLKFPFLQNEVCTVHIVVQISNRLAAESTLILIEDTMRISVGHFSNVCLCV